MELMGYPTMEACPSGTPLSGAKPVGSVKILHLVAFLAATGGEDLAHIGLVPCERGDGRREEREAVAVPPEAHPVLEVHADLVGGVQIVAGVQNTTAPERSGRGNVAAVPQKDKPGKAVVALHADRGAVRTNEPDLAVDEIGLRTPFERRGHLRQRARLVPLVRVEPGDNVARRAAEALVDGVGLAFVGLVDVGEGIAAGLRGRLRRREGGPILQDLDRVVGGAAVHDDVLDLRRPRSVRLREHALERLLQKAPVIVVRGDNRELHLLRHRDRCGGGPQAVQVAVGRRMEGAGDGEGHAEAGRGRGGGRAGRVGHRRAVGGKVRAAELDRGAGAVGNEVQRNPDDVMLRRVRMRDLLADVDLDGKGFAGLRGRGGGNDGNVLFRLPVGGLDGGGEGGVHGTGGLRRRGQSRAAGGRG